MSLDFDLFYRFHLYKSFLRFFYCDALILCGVGHPIFNYRDLGEDHAERELRNFRQSEVAASGMTPQSVGNKNRLLYPPVLKDSNGNPYIQ